MNKRARRCHRHMGVYGVCINDCNEMLVVLKKGGPYDGLYDLPGGGFEIFEGIEECIRREFIEETSMEIESISRLGVANIITNAPYAGYHCTNHIGLLYDVTLKGNPEDLKKATPIDDMIDNDSLGCRWVSVNSFNPKNASPLILEACKLKKLM